MDDVILSHARLRIVATLLHLIALARGAVAVGQSLDAEVEDTAIRAVKLA
jgi:hypothetical protein